MLIALQFYTHSWNLRPALAFTLGLRTLGLRSPVKVAAWASDGRRARRVC